MEQQKQNEKKKEDRMQKQKAVVRTIEQSTAAPAMPALSAAQTTPAATPVTLPAPAAEEKKPAAKKQAVKKEEAIARGVSLPISKKHAMYLCLLIKNKSIDTALAELDDVLKFKKAVPFKGEIPHRHGMMSGRYPQNATKAFISLLKGLRGNIAVAGLDMAGARIASASASWASRPRKAGGMRFKRTHVVLKARETKIPQKMNENKKDTMRAQR